MADSGPTSIDIVDVASTINRHANIRIKRNPKFLCFRCEHSQVMRMEGRQDSVVRCGNIGKWIPDTIVECSSFQALGSVGIWDLAKLAKVIDVDEEPRKAGFLS